MPRIWILDDQANIGLSLRLILEREGHTIRTFEQALLWREALKRETPDLQLLDVRLPDANGIELLRELRATADFPVVMISGHGTIADAVEAIQAGAVDFLEKPLQRERVLVSVARALEAWRLKQENATLRAQLPSATMIGSAPVWTRVVEQARLGAKTDARILLLGESGTGKELLAEQVHRHSQLSAGPFIKMNCAAIPAEILESELFGHEKGAFTGAASLRRGKFELAHQGTLFLDEVGDLALAAQAKLLRVLQEGEIHRLGGEQPIQVKVRVIAATNKDLQTEVQGGRFREDLYYRLAVLPLRVPPLRERLSDVPAMAEHFLADFCQRNGMRAKTLLDEAKQALQQYNWPGNVRELRNVVERMAILSGSDAIGQEGVPFATQAAGGKAAANSLEGARKEAEREMIRQALQDAAGNVSAAARALGLERTALHKKLRALGIRE